MLEANSGEIGDKSFKLMAPFGRSVIYGAKNAHDSFPTEKVRQLIHKNQSVTGFNFPSLQPEQIRESVPALLDLINNGRVKLFAKHFLLDWPMFAEHLKHFQTGKLSAKWC